MTSLNLSGPMALRTPLKLGVWYRPRVNRPPNWLTSFCNMVLELG